GPAVPIAPGQTLFPVWDAWLAGAGMDAALRFAVGQEFPFWQLRVTCDDGVAVADILANRAYRFRRTRWIDAVDAPLSGARAAGRIAADGAANLARYGLSMLRLARGGDAFQSSMNASIAAFHAALDAGRAPEIDAAFGAALVALCARMAEAAPAAAPPAPRPDPDPTPSDIALLGGTGFIGAALLRAALAAGRHPTVMARRLDGLPAPFDDPRVRLLRGDIGDPGAVARAIEGVPVVVNLAHGGGGGTFEAVRAAMLGGAETVARACLAAPSRPRLIHVGSIAALYLGPQDATVTGATPPDPEPQRRGDYAHAKALTDRMLLDLHAREGLAVTILRPGVVVGAGSSPFHSGVGVFNNDQHCIGWNMGSNPLPFVLAEDVAAAILAAAIVPGIEGRCYNLVGDVRLSAREYIAALAHALGRPLRFHPQPPEAHFAVELAKWAIKRAGGRAVPMPSLRDLRSRGMRARFDCADAARDLGWHPVADPAVFQARAIDIHRPG
ncbi:MAG: NAD-dependent epimerase/dehydratase family protein, partial [Rhodospirillales bacterium]|nr:NAD-dependent epimerase/dehydratase family protein [Rhodospirillales bacterium]